MKIINKTKNTTLSDKVIIAQTPLARLKGLLGKKEFKNGEALIIKPCNSIHTFFMRFAIDVLFVGKDNRVIKAFHRLVPFRLTPVYFNSRLVIELPVGTLETTSTKEGDTLFL
jgi:hypothetical protein